MTVNIQIRFPQKIVEMVDEDIKGGYFSSRSDAIRTIVEFYELQNKRKEFFEMLKKREEEINRGKYLTLKQMKEATR
jgi:Arc/MetJ-type ribon-helix-helix transcriptional regulator